MFDPAALSAWGRHALTHPDLSTLLDEASALVTHALDVERCAILELAPDGATLRLGASSGWPEDRAATAAVSTGLAAQTSYTLASGVPVCVPDLRIETRFCGAALFHAQGLISSLSVIIPGHSRPFGVLAAHTVRPRLFGDDEAHGLEAIATMLALSVERLRAVDALRVSGRRVRALFQQSPWGIIAYDPAGLLVEANGAALETVTPEQTARYNVLEDEHLRAAGMMDEIQRAFAGEPIRLAPLFYDPAHIPGAPAGRARWTRGFLSPVLDDTGAVSEVLAMVEDITERHLAEELLRDREAQYRAIFEASSDALITTTLDGRILSANPAACHLYGYSAEALQCLPPTQLIHPDQRDRLAEALHTVAAASGKQPLNLPRMNTIESLPHPKQHLAQLLQQASGLSARRRESFNAAQAARRLAALVSDFSPLRELSAFQCVEADVTHVVREYGWRNG